MFSKIAILATVSLALSVAAAPHDGGSQCDTKNIYCCSEQTETTTTAGLAIIGLLGPSGKLLTGLVGSGCSPLNVLAIQGNSCSNQPVCCEGNKQTNNTNGLLVFNCSPANVNL